MGIHNKIVDVTRLLEIVEDWKAQGLQVVFTNGCFDLVHPGHIRFLIAAQQLGDRLIVAVNADLSVRKLKGASRPIVPEQDRLLAVASQEVVNAVVLFSEDTPEHLIKEIVPDVLVKGSDYKKDNIVGAEIVKQHGGRVELIDLVPGYSTTSVIHKIQSK